MGPSRRAGLLLAAALLLAGCGRDAVRDDLELYGRVVLGEVERAERETDRELAPMLKKLAGGRLAAAEALKLYRGTLTVRYDQLVRDVLETHRPATPELAELHARVVKHYRAIHKEIESAAIAFGKSDWAAVDQAHERLAKLSFAPLRADLEKLARSHGLNLIDPPR